MLNDQELQQFVFKEVIQLVAMLGIDHVLFLGFQLVVEGKLGGRRRVQTGAYQNLSFDHWGEVDGIHLILMPRMCPPTQKGISAHQPAFDPRLPST